MTKRLAIILGFILLLIAPLQAQTQTETTADALVHDSTPIYACNAWRALRRLAAAREAANIIMLEKTHHVGAMNTGGLSHSDSSQMVRSTVVGLFGE